MIKDAWIWYAMIAEVSGRLFQINKDPGFEPLPSDPGSGKDVIGWNLYQC